MRYLFLPPMTTCAQRRVSALSPANNKKGCQRPAHLARDGDLVVLLVAERAVLRVLIVEDQRDAGLLHPGLALLVDQLLQVRSADLCARATASCPLAGRSESSEKWVRRLPGHAGAPSCPCPPQSCAPFLLQHRWRAAWLDGGERPQSPARCTARARARTCVRLEMPSTKQMLSRMLLFPDPFSPVIALNSRSNPLTVVRTAYDLKPSSTISSRCIPAVVRPRTRACRLERLLQYCAAGVALRYDTDTTALSAERNRTLFDERIDRVGCMACAAHPLCSRPAARRSRLATDGGG